MDLKEAVIHEEVEIEDYGKVTEELRDEIKTLVSRERAKFKQEYPETEKTREYKDALDHQIVLAQSKLILDDALSSENVTDSIALVARVDGALAGFSIFTFIGDEVHSSFAGVASEFARRGIATRLLQRQHQLFREMGINEYEAAVWDKSEGIYKKMQQNGEVEIEHIGPRKHDLRIRLINRE